MLVAFFVPATRNPVMFVALLGTALCNIFVIHNALHKGPFNSARLNGAWRLVLTFGSCYPVSFNLAVHNIVHHSFRDGGRADWSHPQHTRFKWNLLNLWAFPDVIGPMVGRGSRAWLQRRYNAHRLPQFYRELAFLAAAVITLMVIDFWGALFFVVVPAHFGLRGILRINHPEHQGCDLTSPYDHSRNFLSPFINFVSCNGGYHTIHHNRPGLHWSELPEHHREEIAPHMQPVLDEPNLIGYLWRAYVLNRPTAICDMSGPPRAENSMVGPEAARPFMAA